MHVNGILGDIQAVGHLDHTVFQVKNSFFVESGYNFFVFVVGGNGRVV